MAKHVRVRLQLEAGGGRCPLDHPREARRRERGSAKMPNCEPGRRNLPSSYGAFVSPRRSKSRITKGTLGVPKGKFTSSRAMG
jgi:hypothetical protein